MVRIMYVDGDLVPQSTTNMPRKSRISKCRDKIRQTPWMQPSRFKHLSITRYEMHPNISENRFRCNESICLSEYHLRKRAKYRSPVCPSFKRRLQRPRTRQKIFHRSPVYADTHKRSSNESSSSEILLSAFCSDDHVFFVYDHLSSPHGTLVWKDQSKEELERDSLCEPQLILHLPQYLYDLIGTCSNFKSRYYQIQLLQA